MAKKLTMLIMNNNNNNKQIIKYIFQYIHLITLTTNYF